MNLFQKKKKKEEVEKLKQLLSSIKTRYTSTIQAIEKKVGSNYGLEDNIRTILDAIDNNATNLDYLEDTISKKIKELGLVDEIGNTLDAPYYSDSDKIRDFFSQRAMPDKTGKILKKNMGTSELAAEIAAHFREKTNKMSNIDRIQSLITYPEKEPENTEINLRPTNQVIKPTKDDLKGLITTATENAMLFSKPEIFAEFVKYYENESRQYFLKHPITSHFLNDGGFENFKDLLKSEYLLINLRANAPETKIVSLIKTQFRTQEEQTQATDIARRIFIQDVAALFLKSTDSNTKKNFVKLLVDAQLSNEANAENLYDSYSEEYKRKPFQGLGKIIEDMRLLFTEPAKPETATVDPTVDSTILNIISMVMGVYGTTSYESSVGSCVFHKPENAQSPGVKLLSLDVWSKYSEMGKPRKKKSDIPASIIDNTDIPVSIIDNTDITASLIDNIDPTVVIKLKADNAMTDAFDYVEELTVYKFLMGLFTMAADGEDICNFKTASQKTSKPTYSGLMLLHLICKYNNDGLFQLFRMVKMLSKIDNKTKKYEPYNTILNKSFSVTLPDSLYGSLYAEPKKKNALSMCLYYWKYNQDLFKLEKLSSSGSSRSSNGISSAFLTPVFLSGGANNNSFPMRDTLMNENITTLPDDIKIKNESIRFVPTGNISDNLFGVTEPVSKLAAPAAPVAPAAPATDALATDAATNEVVAATVAPSTYVQQQQANAAAVAAVTSREQEQQFNQIMAEILNLGNKIAKMQVQTQGTCSEQNNSITAPVIGTGGSKLPTCNFDGIAGIFKNIKNQLNAYLQSLQIPGQRTDKIHIQMYKSLINKANYLENLVVKHFKSSGWFFGEIVDSISGIDNMIQLIKDGGIIPTGNYLKKVEIKRQPLYKDGMTKGGSSRKRNHHTRKNHKTRRHRQ